MSEYAVGMIGLGVMGRNLSFNMEEKGFSVAAYDAWPDPVDRFVAEGAGKNVAGFKDPVEMVRSLRRPRRIILLIKAGAVTDKGIASIKDALEPGDMIVDAGNEHFTQTERRAGELSGAHIRFFGMGVSGGEEGARHGPSLMPGGDKAAYEELAPIFTKIAAQTSDGPCVTYCGPGGAGHYVKMVHNGIEYGDMQLIAEAYSVLKNIGGLTNAELAEVFDEWNQGELQSFLIEITADIFRKKDPEGMGDLLDAVLDAAAAKGTGKWTVQDAAEIGGAIPTIATSVEARTLSSRKADRVKNSKVLKGPTPTTISAGERKQLIADVRAALYASKACSYAQGMDLLKTASDARTWGFNLAEFARIWQAGCIIRAKFLSRIKAAYERDAALSNLLLDPEFVDELAQRQAGWRATLGRAVASGVPLLTMGASLSYYDTIRTERLGANLIQAQRDCFGAHTYKRLDREGDFHTPWR
ncbi:MAG: NADP-dependent phosphogluconate dehydrogenase [Polyangiaceae bacterium]